MSKGKCKFCGIELPDKGNIRCDTCNTAWEDGAKYGEDKIRTLLAEMFRHFKNLAGISEDCKPRMSIEQVKKEIKDLYKPLQKEELVNVIYDWDVKNKLLYPNDMRTLSDAIINAREK